MSASKFIVDHEDKSFFLDKNFLEILQIWSDWITIGKWWLSPKLTWTGFHEKFVPELVNVKSKTEPECSWFCLNVIDPLFKHRKFEDKIVCLSLKLLKFPVGSPHNLLLALKSPQIMKFSSPRNQKY